MQLPCLGLNILRYNIGGTGKAGDVPDTTENYANVADPYFTPYYKEIQGYWKDWNSKDPNSMSWDWTRDSNQRAMLGLANACGVKFFEFFSNAPMWWMTTQKSSMGGEDLSTVSLSIKYPPYQIKGTLQTWNHWDFSHYVASVVNYATIHWGINVHSVDIMNEPSSGFWVYNSTIDQEGLNVGDNAVKVTLLDGVRTQLNAFGRQNVLVSGVDENTYLLGLMSLPDTQDHVDQVNVHGYANDDDSRKTLATQVYKKFWMSEMGGAFFSTMLVLPSKQLSELINRWRR